MSLSAAVDVVIPVHTDKRPIRRAVASVLTSQHASALVVCHNVSADSIYEKLEGLDLSRLRLIEHRDELRSPAGPLNAGVRATRSKYLTFLGSDDELDKGILDAWAMELNGQDVHIGQLFADGGRRVLSPAPRVGRYDRLHPVKDLLNYRTSPVATLVNRELITSESSPWFTEGVRTGEDIALGVFLWKTARRIS